MDVLNIRIDELTLEQARNRIIDFMRGDRLRRVFTPNPEMLVAAQKSPHFARILNSADLSLCDGTGVEILSKGKLKRIPGVDFMVEILRIAEGEGKSVFLLGGGKTKTLKKLFEYIQKHYPKLQVAGMHTGPHFFVHKGKIHFKNIEEEIVNQKVLEDIRMNKPDILFVAFGHEKQETWIDEHADSLKAVKIAMGVGGAFDYISGSIRRAPEWLRNMGFEWLYRFFTQPKRFSRIITATIIFPYYALIKNR